ncbi:OsmC family protein [Jeotgalibacillus campisalis]|uniref:Osmotically inducible protein C n=1 Tax=Jeotgalibacillus campisalis TaxID=220754 RepID=A0A0C2VRT3_9BACL|nr:OsmC family protein [Jeotgalibacillus campisalis]KIL47151.1 osmotically inducible protein C [Jeotgalibacillus campisalis]
MKFTMKEQGFTSELPYGSLDVSGNEEYGFRPYQLLTASIAVCSGGVLRSVLNKMRLPFEDIAIEAEVERNEALANRVEKIHVHFIITASDIDEKKVHKALELTRKNCSMVQSVLDSIEVTETFEII